MPTSLPSKYSSMPVSIARRLHRCGAAGRMARIIAVAICVGPQSRQRTALGWQENPMLEQTGAAPSALRVQFTQSSVHRLQFGGPLCTEVSCGGAGGFGISMSAARTVSPARAPPRGSTVMAAKRAVAIIRAMCRILISRRVEPKESASKTNGRNEFRPL